MKLEKARETLTKIGISKKNSREETSRYVVAGVLGCRDQLSGLHDSLRDPRYPVMALLKIYPWWSSDPRTPLYGPVEN